MDGDTSTTGQGDDTASPLALSSSGENFVQSVGQNAAAGAVDTVGAALPDLSSAAGASFVTGALGQVSDSIGPYLPYIIVGGAVLLFIGMRR
jgi:hypothetical protein